MFSMARGKQTLGEIWVDRCTKKRLEGGAGGPADKEYGGISI